MSCSAPSTVSCRSQTGPLFTSQSGIWGKLHVFHLFQTGMFSEAIKAPTSAPAFVASPQPPVSEIKLSTACSGSLCCIHVIRTPPEPQTLRTICLLLQQKREINRKTTTGSSVLEDVSTRCCSSCTLSFRTWRVYWNQTFEPLNVPASESSAEPSNFQSWAETSRRILES